MIGFVPSDFYVSRKISEGDILLCIGWCAKEGVGIIASEGYEKLESKLSKKALDKLVKLGENISVVQIALQLNKKFKPKLMHDATEGGILGACYETIATEKFGLELISENFPFTTETIDLFKILDVDPLKVISSGTLLLVVDSADVDEIIKLSTEEIPITKIGEIVNKEKGITLDGKLVDPPEADAVIQALEKIQDCSF